MSALSLVSSYLRQRARLRLLVPLSILLAIAGRYLVVPPTNTLAAIAIAAVEALGLVLAFRIWDDLEDRDSDRTRHPDRVLASASTTAPFKLLGLAFATASLVPLFSTPFLLRRLAGLLIGIAILSIWYGVRSTSRRRHALGEHILAIKYPLIAYAVAPELPADVVTPRIVAILAAVYSLVCVYEYAEDAELRHVFTSRRSVL